MKRLAFSDPMMRALAAGQKTMTRRTIKKINVVCHGDGTITLEPDEPSRFRVGDLVAATCAFNSGTNSTFGDWKAYRYQFSAKELPMFDPKWKAARIMPAALAPFVLRITEVRYERLGSISVVDAISEGMLHWIQSTHLFPDTDPRECFSEYWNQLYGDGAWRDAQNDLVWVYRFEIAERRI